MPTNDRYRELLQIVQGINRVVSELNVCIGSSALGVISHNQAVALGMITVDIERRIDALIAAETGSTNESETP